MPARFGLPPGKSNVSGCLQLSSDLWSPRSQAVYRLGVVRVRPTRSIEGPAVPPQNYVHGVDVDYALSIQEKLIVNPLDLQPEPLALLLRLLLDGFSLRESPPLAVSPAQFVSRVPGSKAMARHGYNPEKPPLNEQVQEGEGPWAFSAKTQIAVELHRDRHEGSDRPASEAVEQVGEGFVRGEAADEPSLLPIFGALASLPAVLPLAKDVINR